MYYQCSECSEPKKPGQKHCKECGSTGWTAREPVEKENPMPNEPSCAEELLRLIIESEKLTEMQSIIKVAKAYLKEREETHE